MRISTKTSETSLRNDIHKVLCKQGYQMESDRFVFNDESNEGKRNLHEFPRAEKIKEHIHFIQSFLPKAEKYVIDSSDIEIEKIQPRLINIKSRTKEGNLFLWWNLVWWSLPYSKSYGRQMRFMVWDDYHDCPMGLIGLQSPILSWGARDNYLNIAPLQRDYWVNQSLSAQRLGALPPYNKFLSGKLIASIMTSNEIRNAFRKKYHKSTTLLLGRTLPANLLFITTTGAYGKSSVYNRLKFHDQKICEFIGYTNGHGSFHIPDTLYERFIAYLHKTGHKVGRAYGNGPSIKMRNIHKTMNLLGFKNGSQHGMKRAVYLFPFVENLHSVLQGAAKPIWYSRSIDELTDYWQKRWAYKRSKDTDKTFFRKEDFIEALYNDLENCKNLV